MLNRTLKKMKNKKIAQPIAVAYQSFALNFKAGSWFGFDLFVKKKDQISIVKV
jgi:hypothetical protein